MARINGRGGTGGIILAFDPAPGRREDIASCLRAGQLDAKNGFSRLHQVEAVAGDGFEVFPVVAQEVKFALGLLQHGGFLGLLAL